MTAPDFYLTSSESNTLTQPRACWSQKQLVGEVRKDCLWIKVEPPVLGQQFGLGKTDIADLIIATRHQGASLFPINEWPLYVYVCRPLKIAVLELGKFAKDEIEIIGWGELYPNLQMAKDNSR